MMENFSLRAKLLVPIAVLMTSMFVITQWFSVTNALKKERHSLIERVRVLSEGVAVNLKAAALLDESATAADVLSTFSVDPSVVQVELFDKYSQLITRYRLGNTWAAVPNEVARQKLKEQRYAITGDYIYLWVPVTAGGEFVGKLSVVVSAASLIRVYEIAIYNGIGFFLLLLLGGTTLYLSAKKYVLGPLHTLNLAMGQFIDNRRQLPVVDIVSDDEIGELVSAFNMMLERLNQRESQILNTLDKLEHQKAFATELIETVQHALIVADKEGNIIHFNLAATQMFNVQPEIMKKANLFDLIPTPQQQILIQTLHHDIQLDDRLFSVIRENGKELLLEVTSRVLSRPGHILFAVQDVMEIEAALNRQRLAASIFESSKDGIVVVNSYGLISMVNPAFSDLLGYDSGSVLNHRPDEVLAWRQFSTLMPVVLHSLETEGQWQGEVWEKHKHGHLVPMFVRVMSIPRQDGLKGFDMVYTLSDLSNLKEMERLEFMAHHDLLTGLANRAQLYRFLGDWLKIHYRQKRDCSTAIFYLDLDGFKGVNDTYGHNAGDEVLKQVAGRLQSLVRDDDLAARLSGDEFVLVMNPCRYDEAEVMAARLLKLFSQEILYQDEQLHIGASIGIYLIGDKQEPLESVLKAADRAMYQAKASGKNRFVILNQRNMNQTAE